MNYTLRLLTVCTLSIPCSGARIASVATQSPPVPELHQDGSYQKLAHRFWPGRSIGLSILADPGGKKIKFNWSASVLPGVLDQRIARQTDTHAVRYYPTNALFLTDGSLLISGVNSVNGDLIVENWTLEASQVKPSALTYTNQSTGQTQVAWSTLAVTKRDLIFTGSSSIYGVPESMIEMFSPTDPSVLIRRRGNGSIFQLIMGSQPTITLIASASASSGALVEPALDTNDLLTTSRRKGNGDARHYIFSNFLAQLSNLQMDDVEGVRLTDQNKDGVIDSVESSSPASPLAWFEDDVF